MNDAPQCYALHKPYGVLSQFTSEGGHPGLQSLNLDLPQDIYPVGRLDRDSEGLLLLSNNSKLIHELLEPSKGHPRTYRVQVEGLASTDQIQAIQKPKAVTCHTESVYQFEDARVKELAMQLVGFLKIYRDKDKAVLLKDLQAFLEPDSWEELNRRSKQTGGAWSGKVLNTQYKFLALYHLKKL